MKKLKIPTMLLLVALLFTAGSFAQSPETKPIASQDYASIIRQLSAQLKVLVCHGPSFPPDPWCGIAHVRPLETEADAIDTASEEYPAVSWSSAYAAYFVSDGNTHWLVSGSLPNVQEPVIIIVD